MKNWRIRKITLVFLIIITILGFISKYYQGPYSYWLNNNVAGLFYEIFWILLFFLIFIPADSINKIPVIVFIITVLLELIQLCHLPFLEKIRSCFIGRTLIGSTFSFVDIIHYFFGCLIGWLVLKFILQKTNKIEF